ncbi:unnamed protein product [Blepharisma stoltei]|uniref:Protein kinase domain-containing protein n=1 Tax=Blepharisma stoltei TaxID=1481888 RepID=A0AAU9JIR0_9CILI|nr:unnamed protein product [Blepharisma stoltei]
MKSKQLPTLKTSRSQPDLYRNSLPSNKTPSSPRHDPFLSLTRNESGKLLPVCPSGLRIPGTAKRPSIVHPQDIFQNPSSQILPPLNPRRDSLTFSTRKSELIVSRTTKNMKRLGTPCFGSSGSESAESVSTMLTIEDIPPLSNENYIYLENPETIYQLTEKIGDGPYGSVYKALHKSTKSIVAIKIIRLNNADINLIQKDLAVLKNFRSSNIVEFLESYIKGNELWIIMEYFKACCITDLIRNNKKCFDEIQISAICQAALRAIDYLHHNKISHGNLKGRNILIEEGGLIKLSDYGLSAILFKNKAKVEAFIRNSYYMSPESLPQPNFYRSDDIWSLGITAIEMAEGSAPYINILPERAMINIKRNPAQSLADTHKWSEEFNDFISKCLIIDPNQRSRAKDLLIHPFIRGAKGPKVLKELLINTNEKLIGSDENRKEEEDCNEPEKQESEETVVMKLMKHTVKSPKSPCFLKRQQPLHGSFLNNQLRRRSKKVDSLKDC